MSANNIHIKRTPPILRPDLARIQKAVAGVRLAMGEDAFTEAERRGRAMSEAEAVAFARGDLPGPPANVRKNM